MFEIEFVIVDMVEYCSKKKEEVKAVSGGYTIMMTS